MLDNLPSEILYQVVHSLDCKDTRNLVLVKREFNEQFGKEFLKTRFHYLAVQKLINRDFPRFKKEIQTLSKEDLEKVFFRSLHKIDTVMMNKEQGFYEMKYICECMILGCRIDDSIWHSLYYSGQHFYEYFHSYIVKAIGSLGHNEREQIQKNIDNCRKLKSLHTNFIPFHREQR